TNSPSRRGVMGRGGCCALLLALGGNLAMAQAPIVPTHSVSPEFPPATTYGSTMYRNDDPRSHYQSKRFMPLDVTAPTEVLLQQLWLTENQVGAYSPELVPELRGLGAALFADGQYKDAIDSYRRAIHLLRVNEGLNTLSQTGMVEQLVEAYVELGDFVAADDQQLYLHRVRKQHLAPDDPEMLEAVEQLADWHRNAYLSQLDKYRYPRIVDLFDLYDEMADAVGEIHGDNSRKKLPYLMGKLKTEYLLSVYPGESEEPLQVEAEQRQNADLPDLTKLRFIGFRNDNYRHGLASLREMLGILASDPNTTRQEMADVIVMKGDWYQWHRRYAQAIRLYREAWNHVEGQPDAEQWRAATFSNPLELPSETVFQPGRMPLRLYHGAEVQARFAVTRHGEAHDIEILSPDRSDNQPAVTRGYKYLRDMRFRPRLKDGVVVTAAAIERTYNIRY
ncbi:MAG: tetratricopeptide repeat protein, partial [Halieaceae bacterium]|nr:tetratricopeptide repeat protein [Halieaceae bacterium]